MEAPKCSECGGPGRKTLLSCSLCIATQYCLVMIQRKSANPYARKTEKGPRPGGAVKAPAFSSKLHLNSDCYTKYSATSHQHCQHSDSHCI